MKTQGSAAELLNALRAPIYNRVIKKEVGRGELDYEVYLRTSELLALQTPTEQLVVPDELLFQVMHQTQELWMKALAFECVAIVGALDADDALAAGGALDRVITIARCLATEIRVLHTLPPDTFQVIRRHLGNGSGMESPGYNQVMVSAASALAAFERMLARRSATLYDVYADRRAFPDVFRIAEQMVDWDEAFQAWLFAHYTLVRRTIGVDRSVQALDGFPTVALQARMTKPLFPALWDVRVEMTRRWDRGSGYAPGEPRTSSGMHARVKPSDEADEG